MAHHVVADTYFCNECHHECRVDKRQKLFRCDRQVTVKLEEGHEKTFISKSLVAGTWFDKQKFSQKKICRFCSVWLVLPHPRSLLISRELSISQKSVTDWGSFCREVCQFWIEQRSEVLGGPGKIVEIDEAKIGH